MNATQMVTRATEFLQDPNNVRWSTTQILEYVNDGQLDFARSTNINQQLSAPLAASTTTPANTFYTLPADFMELAAGGVWSLANGINLQLRPITPNTMGSNWDQLTSGIPYGYVWPLEFGPNPTTGPELRIWPIPPAALTGVTIYYLARPADLVSGGSPTTSVIPAQYHLALVYYAVAMCFLQDGQYKDPAAYAAFWDRYQREIVDAQRAYERRFSAAPTTIRRPYL